MRINKAKLIPAQKAKDYVVFLLTQEQRYFEQSVERARGLLSDLRHVIDFELKQLINGIGIEVDINLCQGNSLDLWLKESGRVMMGCSLLNAKDEQSYLAMDYISANHLADLCLGGEMSQSPASPVVQELSATECRVTGRLLHRITLGLQQRLQGEKSALPASRIDKMVSPESFSYLPFKVRAVMEKDALSWFIWLPTTLFLAEPESVQQEEKQPMLEKDQWLDFQVKGRVEMASKSISLSQLNHCLNGAVLPIEMNTDAIFKLDKKVLFKGRVAEENNSLAFQVSKTKELAL